MCHFLGIPACDESQSMTFLRALTCWMTGFEMFMNIAKNEQDDQLEYYAWYMIGVYYRHGYGIAKDYEQTLTYFKRAASKDNEFVCYSLGEIAANPKAVIKYFKLASNQHNTQATRRLPELYTMGEYHPTDDEKFFSRYLMLDELYEDNVTCIKLLGLFCMNKFSNTNPSTNTKDFN